MLCYAVAGRIWAPRAVAHAGVTGRVMLGGVSCLLGRFGAMFKTGMNT